MKALVIISRLFVGVVFTSLGFVKSVDPIGTQIKFEEYFEVMGLDFLMPFSITFSFLLNAAELIIGLMLIFNLLSKLTSWAALFFLTLFTPLTLWLAVTNSVTDCGCFGDAFTLSNWQTFWKNIVLLLFVLLFFIYGKKYTSRFSVKQSLLISALFLAAIFSFQFYNFANIPVIDFRPFKVGVNIIEDSIIPNDAPKDSIEMVFYYKNKKTGESTEFTIDNLPEDESLWEWESREDKLISKGYEPPIHDFFLNNLSGKDLTSQILNNPGTSFILILHNFEKGIKALNQDFNEIAKYAEQNNIEFYCFTASESSEIRKYKGFLPRSIEICTGDYKMLKTFIRANPGFVILENAVIKEKIPYSKADKYYKRF